MAKQFDRLSSPMKSCKSRVRESHRWDTALSQGLMYATAQWQYQEKENSKLRAQLAALQQSHCEQMNALLREHKDEMAKAEAVLHTLQVEKQQLTVVNDGLLGQHKVHCSVLAGLVAARASDQVRHDSEVQDLKARLHSVEPTTDTAMSNSTDSNIIEQHRSKAGLDRRKIKEVTQEQHDLHNLVKASEAQTIAHEAEIRLYQKALLETHGKLEKATTQLDKNVEWNKRLRNDVYELNRSLREANSKLNATNTPGVGSAYQPDLTPSTGLQAAQAQIQATNAELRAAKREITRVTTQLNTAEALIESQKGRIDTSQQWINSLDKAITALEAEKVAL
ncbi:hypothetical protein AOQ84DRAFT_372406 [Glonium stellatum]|uniref:Uncharacterized protein n=1 Tax=Glonium stellatum TaxID=574774 RepID=A0A8E2JXF6_9PEZI|nr:hypothetical protein AOQ84DRAFT_372406 [Glonium stellatum]